MRLNSSSFHKGQWQRAAQGDDGREYPWGIGFDPTRCNTAESAIGRATPVTVGLTPSDRNREALRRVERRNTFGRTIPMGRFS